MVAYPQPNISDEPGSYQYVNSMPFPIQRPYASATTYPFRVRGTQVQVFSETVNNINRVPDAIVFRQLNESNEVSPMADTNSSQVFVTDNNGYLSGRGELALGDHLFAALPMDTTYRLPPQLLFGGVDGLGEVVLDNPPTDGFTTEFWLRAFSDSGVIISDGATFTLENPSNLTLQIGNQATQTGVQLNDGAIHHLGLSWQKNTGRWRLYLDGEEVATGILGSGTALDMNILTFGDGYNGFMDEIRLWNTVRTPGQIVNNYDVQLSGNESGLIGYWPVEEDDIGRVYDHSGNGSDMTVTGGALLIAKPLYTLYHTSATPTEDGLDLQEVTEPGVQQLVVSADNPLVLFDLDISLEWDASNDPVFLEQLEIAIQQASATLYDVTNGQMALGNVFIYHNKERWLTADVAIKASNNVRPSAAIGGMVSFPQDDVVSAEKTIANAFVPGQIRLGPSWDPFGQTTNDLNQSWWQSFAHELGHYLLYLPDNYLAINDGRLTTTDCFGSFMTNAYNSDYSEFLTNSGWQTPACQQTIAAQTTGRYDWETILQYYPFLKEPVSSNKGPGFLPLAVTQVFIDDPDEATNTLTTRFFELRDDSNTLISLPEAQAYLYKTWGTLELTDDRLVQLGGTNGSGQFLTVRGAAAGDRICVISTQNITQIGCETISNIGSTVTMVPAVNWAPQIQVTPVSTTSLQVEVTQPLAADEVLKVQILPLYEPLSATILSPWTTMTPLGNGRYEATLTAEFPIFAGSVRVWVDGPTPREAVVPYILGEGFDANQFAFGVNEFIFDANQFAFGANQFAFGANQFAFGANQFAFGANQFAFGANQFAFGANQFAFGANQFAFGTNQYTFDANRRPWGAPVSSANREVTIINGTDPFAETGVAFIQELANLPNLDPWLAPIGSGYRVALVDDAPVLSRNITFQYLPQLVPDGYENEALMQVYFSADEGTTWQPLSTIVDTDENLAIADMEADANGLYVLAVTIAFSEFGQGWNNFGFPIQASQSVTFALASIEGNYSAVAHYDPTHVDEPWQTYFPTVRPPFEPLVNTLTELTFLQQYQVYMTEADTLTLNPGGSSLRTAEDLTTSSQPPAVFYGWVIPSSGFTPHVGDVVTATINGQKCGRGELVNLTSSPQAISSPVVVPYAVYLPLVQVTQNDGLLAYKLVVETDSGQGCGVPGRMVEIRINGQLIQTHPWVNNYEACYLPLNSAAENVVICE